MPEEVELRFDEVPWANGSMFADALHTNHNAPEMTTMDFNVGGTDYLVAGSAAWNGWCVPSSMSAGIGFVLVGGSSRGRTSGGNYVY